MESLPPSYEKPCLQQYIAGVSVTLERFPFNKKEIFKIVTPPIPPNLLDKYIQEKCHEKYLEKFIKYKYLFYHIYEPTTFVVSILFDGFVNKIDGKYRKTLVIENSKNKDDAIAKAIKNLVENGYNIRSILEANILSSE